MKPDLTTVQSEQRRSRLLLILVIAFFAAPVVLAWLAFYVFPDWRPSGTVNNGELVEPVLHLPDFNLATVDGTLLDQTVFRGKWTLLVFVEGDCQTDCIRRLYDIRQIRLAQGKNIDRLQRLVLLNRTGPATATGKELQAEFPGLLVIPVSREANGKLISGFELDGEDPLSAGRLYLVDPLGNLMMHYAPDADPRAVIKDLERLLKYSGLG